MKLKSLFHGTLIAVAVLICGQEVTAQQAGCLGQIKSNAVNAKLYLWPDAIEAEKILDLNRNEDIRVYTEYVNSSWYLVKATRGNPSRAINGFVEKRMFKPFKPSKCFSHRYRHPNLPYPGTGREYVVLDSVESIYLRDANGKNHSIGLMRAKDRFVRHKLAKDKNQILGWAFSRGVNPRFRYGSVIVARKKKDGTIERFLEPKP